MTRLLSIFAVTLVTPMFATGCDKTCEKLRAKVCDDQRYYRENRQHCDLLTEEERFESLSSASCKSILDHISRR